MAWHSFHCDYCIAPIEPGDEYTRDVYANHYHLRVMRRHHPNCYAPTEEEDLEIREQMRREREREEQEVMERVA